MPASDLIRLRYGATCASCGSALARGSHARWDRSARTATCKRCVERDCVVASAPAELDRGDAGRSAAREWQRRHDRRENRIRAEHKHLGALMLALSSDPYSTSAWGQGAKGERVIGRRLDRLRDDGIAVLHDRRFPGSRANIDHIVVSQAGVFVIDTKHYKGRVEQRDPGGCSRLIFGSTSEAVTGRSSWRG